MKILIITNNDVGLYKFRRELLEELLKEHEVVISLPNGPFVEPMIQMGCRFLQTEFNRQGMNPLGELKLLSHYRKMIREVKPDVVLTYTIKPNVYGGMVCGALGVPYIANVTGLGMSIENPGPLQKVALTLYRLGLRRAAKVFFQNQVNLNFMRQNGVVGGTCELLPGSGVNLTEHCFEPYPADTGKPVFVTIGRIMRDKGIEELLAAARAIKSEYPDVTFRLIGSYDQNYQEQVQSAVRDGVLEYLGFQEDVHSFIRDSWATIHPSYHEGMSNVLLESAAAGRPVIASDVPGCRETFDEDVSGIACEPRDAESLTRAIRKFLSLSYEEKVRMGTAGRAKVEKEFDRKIVVSAYLRKINQILGEMNNETV